VDDLPAMLSIGTLGMRQGRREEPQRMQKELTLLMRANAVTTTAEEDEEGRRRHLTLNGGIFRHKSFRKLMLSVLSGFLPRLSFRGTTPELIPTEVLLQNAFGSQLTSCLELFPVKSIAISD
jgi:hypothetical protein